MSKISLAPNASGTGTLTISAPNTSTDRTINLPDAAGTVFVSGQALSATTGSFSGDVTLGSSVLATPSGSAPSYTCRAWVNFNGTGTVAIRASGNVSSITDHTTGQYTVNFTTAMPDANYGFNITRGVNPGTGFIAQQDDVSIPTTSGIRLVCVNAANTLLQDVERINVAIFR